MQGFGTLLASNWMIVALANIGGVISLCVLTLVAFKRARSLLVDIWTTSVRKALEARRLQYRRKVAESAEDVHIFLTHVVTNSVCAILLTFPLLIFGLVPGLLQSVEPGKVIPKIFPAIFTVISCVTNLAAVTLLADLLNLAREVRAIRSRRASRQLQPRAVEAEI